MYQLMKRVNAMPNGTKRAFRLRINFHGPYSMKLIVEKSPHGHLYMTINENKCLYLSYSELSEPRFLSQIYADTADRRCFNPAPNTKRFRMLDFLAVLLTKLMIAIIAFGPRSATNTNGEWNYEDEYEGDEENYGYNSQEESKITLTDIAKKDGVALTPYKILRGEAGIYERYGYHSAALDRVYDKLHFLQIRNLPYEIRSSLAEVLGKEPRPHERVLDIMEDVPWEAEEVHHISEKIVDDLLPESYNSDGKSINMVLNEKSKQWAKWDAEMQLVGVGRWDQRHTRRRS